MQVVESVIQAPEFCNLFIIKTHHKWKSFRRLKIILHFLSPSFLVFSPPLAVTDTSRRSSE